jgi:hypothetical protein
MDRKAFLNHFARSSVAALGALLASACNVHLGDSTTGDKGTVAFQYTGWSCFFGCDTSTPLLVGTKQRISVSGRNADDAGVTAKSKDPAVATFEVARNCSCEQSDANGTTMTSTNEDGTCRTGFSMRCENEVTVSAIAPGETGLELLTKDGAIIDETTIVVDRARSATIHDSQGVEIGPTVSMHEGDDVHLAVRLLDSKGKQMLADEGVRWDIEGTAASSGSCLLCTSDETSLLGPELGRSTVTMAAPGVRSSFVVSVEQSP